MNTYLCSYVVVCVITLVCQRLFNLLYAPRGSYTSSCTNFESVLVRLCNCICVCGVTDFSVCMCVCSMYCFIYPCPSTKDLIFSSSQLKNIINSKSLLDLRSLFPTIVNEKIKVNFDNTFGRDSLFLIAESVLVISLIGIGFHKITCTLILYTTYTMNIRWNNMIHILSCTNQLNMIPTKHVPHVHRWGSGTNLSGK